MLLAMVLAAAASPLFADPEIEAALGRIQASPGAWVEYAVRTRGKQGARVRATVLLAREPGRYWLELAAAEAASGVAGAVRLLIREGRGPGSAERVVVLLAGQDPVEVTAERSPPPKAPGSIKPLGMQEIRVPAGVFSARALRVSGTTRVWRAAGVPLWGLVKARSSRQTLELLAWGREGGHSVFPPDWDQGNGSESANQ
jgi:hypothetical protein